MKESFKKTLVSNRIGRILVEPQCLESQYIHWTLDPQSSQCNSQYSCLPDNIFYLCSSQNKEVPLNCQLLYICNLIYKIFHMKKTIQAMQCQKCCKFGKCTCKTNTWFSCICHVCGYSFKVKCNIRKHLQNKHLIFFHSNFKISIYQIYFTKSKTSTNEKWKH